VETITYINDQVGEISGAALAAAIQEQLGTSTTTSTGDAYIVPERKPTKFHIHRTLSSHFTNEEIESTNNTDCMNLM
jgi:hypothetical protein